jgi:hypothetical protein
MVPSLSSYSQGVPPLEPLNSYASGTNAAELERVVRLNITNLIVEQKQGRAGSSPTECLCQISGDKVALEHRHSFDPAHNRIVGGCYEHQGCVADHLVFNNIGDLEAYRSAFEAKQFHSACEMLVRCGSMFREHNATCTPIATIPSCKKLDHNHQFVISAVVRVWQQLHAARSL